MLKSIPWLMSLLLKRQIERLELAIELSTDWLEIQYLRAELDQLKDLYEEPHAGVAWSKVFVQDACQLLAADPWIVWPMHSPAVLTSRNRSNQRKKGSFLIQWDALTDLSVDCSRFGKIWSRRMTISWLGHGDGVFRGGRLIAHNAIATCSYSLRQQR